MKVSGGLGLEFLSEPALVVTLAGELRLGNAAARGLFGSAAFTQNLFDLVLEGRDEVAAYLRQASASTSPRVGSITVAVSDETERFRAFAARLQCGEIDELLLILRLTPVRDDQFSILNRRIRDLDANLHQRLKENAALQEALAENRILVRELQHRVKNNIQQMLSLIKMSADAHGSADVLEVVQTASRRLHAMAMTQEALYQSSAVGSISVRSFLIDVVKGAAASYGTAETLSLSIEDGRTTSEEAHCLALIANELITNAYKHGAGEVSVRFAAEPEGFCLEVRDRGPGFHEEAVSRASGLMLVRGLCRQISGKLQIANDGGARFSVQFQSELARVKDHEASFAAP